MNRSERLLREARRHSMFLLLSIVLTVSAIIGAAIGYQDESPGLLAVSALAAVLFIHHSIRQSMASARHMRLHDLENQFSQPPGKGDPNAARDAEQI